MKFTVLPAGRRPPTTATDEAFLVSDNWDDWFRFSTLFHLHASARDGAVRSIGLVKIGQFGMKEDQRSPALPKHFEVLDDSFFSLGQDDDYYSSLSALGDTIRDQVLSGLHDLAADEELFERALSEDVTGNSLLRSVTPSTVRGQFRRMTKGGTRLSRYRFSFEAPKPKGTGIEPLSIDFSVKPDSVPPTNIHVLIGRNGVGKTHLLGSMADSLLEEGDPSSWGVFSFGSQRQTEFANLVSVSFSAFDEFELTPDRKSTGDSLGYSYVGLKRTTNRGADRGTPKSPAMLRREFVESLRVCFVGSRRARWLRAIDALQADPVFRDADVASLAASDVDDPAKLASSLFGRLSSGHKIILLTMTRLVELVEERTLVTLDEPEAHLHPPLLSAFIRALSDLLVNRNGVALIATHSPVVMQEVPADCAWVLRRNGRHTTAERPRIETFGENVGVLTREVFGLEMTDSGYHALLTRSVERHRDYDAVVREYDGRLGAEAKALVRALVQQLESDS